MFAAGTVAGFASLLGGRRARVRLPMMWAALVPFALFFMAPETRFVTDVRITSLRRGCRGRILPLRRLGRADRSHWNARLQEDEDHHPGQTPAGTPCRPAQLGYVPYHVSPFPPFVPHSRAE